MKFNSRVKRMQKAGMAENTVAAYQKDIRYFWSWAKIAHNLKPHYPIDTKLIETFLIDHLEGLKPAIDIRMVAEKIKAKRGKQSIPTVERKLKALAWLHKTKGLSNPCNSEIARSALLSAKRIFSKTGKRRQSKAITKPILTEMLATFSNSLIDTRDRAILVFGFYTGGRRRSEIVRAEYRYLTKIRGGYEYFLHRSKTDQIGKGQQKLLRNPYAKELTKWLDMAGIKDGYLFRSIRHGRVLENRLNGTIVNRIVKYRIDAIGKNPSHYSAHGLRRGFITECGRQGVGIIDAMQLTGHKDIKTAVIYYEQGTITENPATRI